MALTTFGQRLVLGRLAPDAPLGEVLLSDSGRPLAATSVMCQQQASCTAHTLFRLQPRGERQAIW